MWKEWFALSCFKDFNSFGGPSSEDLRIIYDLCFVESYVLYASPCSGWYAPGWLDYTKARNINFPLILLLPFINP